MNVVLIELEKVIRSSRMDYDFFDPNQKKAIETTIKGYSKDKLANVCLYVNTGKTAPRNSYPEQGVRIIKVKNTTGNGINWNEKFYVSEAFYEKAKKKAKVDKSDILMLCSAHNKSYIGRCDIIDNVPDTVISDSSRCCCVGELIIIRADPKKINPEYLVTFLRLPIVQEQIRRMVKGQSAHLYSKDLRQLDVIIPPPDTQIKVAKINRDSQISYNTKLREAKECLAQERELITKIILTGK